MTDSVTNSPEPTLHSLSIILICIRISSGDIYHEQRNISFAYGPENAFRPTSSTCCGTSSNRSTFSSSCFISTSSVLVGAASAAGAVADVSVDSCFSLLPSVGGCAGGSEDGADIVMAVDCFDEYSDAIKINLFTSSCMNGECNCVTSRIQDVAELTQRV